MKELLQEQAIKLRFGNPRLSLAAIAHITNTPLSTVHRWIKVYLERGMTLDLRHRNGKKAPVITDEIHDFITNDEQLFK